MKRSSVKKAGRIAFIQACWHKDIVDECRKSFIYEIGKLGHAKNTIDIFDVPGVLEIPLQCKLLAEAGKYDAIVCSGFVVNGGIYRHEFVADVVMKGMMDVMLEFDLPIISAVLTPIKFHEHENHHKFFLEHFVSKGKEAADACAAMIKNVAKVA